MKKLKVATVVGTRPEIIRLSRIIDKLDIHCDHKLIHTGQNYDFELNNIFFEELKVRKPDHFLESGKDSKSAAYSIGKIIMGIDEIFEKIKPEALLVLGDTNSCLAVISAKRRKIPIFHIEAGNRCFDYRVPEEINRKIVDHTSDINLTYSSIAREYLLREGINPSQIIKIGSPMLEVINYFNKEIENSNIIKSLSLEKKKYFVVSVHREENIDLQNNFVKVVDCINKIANEYKMPIIFSTHPRTRKNIERKNILFEKNVKLIKPLGYFDYVKLQTNARIVISDSGTITEESSILGFLAINLRENHERPEGMEQASVILSGLNSQRVIQSIKVLEKQSSDNANSFQKVYDYHHDNVSDKVVRIIHSYVDFVNQNVWKK